MASNDPLGLMSVSTIIRLVKVVRAHIEASWIKGMVLDGNKLNQKPLKQSITPSI